MCLGVTSLASVEFFPKPTASLPSSRLYKPMQWCQSAFSHRFIRALQKQGLLSKRTFQHHFKNRGQEERKSFKYILRSVKNNKSQNKMVTKGTKPKKVPEWGFGRNLCQQSSWEDSTDVSGFEISNPMELRLSPSPDAANPCRVTQWQRVLVETPAPRWPPHRTH